MTPGHRGDDPWAAAIDDLRHRRGERERLEWLLAQAHGRVLFVGGREAAAQTLAAGDHAAVEFVDVDPERIAALGGESFDSVMVDEALERIGEPDPVLGAIVRVARANASIAIATRFGHGDDEFQLADFFVASLLDVLSPHLTVETMTIDETHLRVLARPGPMDAQAHLRALADAQPLLEGRILALQAEAARSTERSTRLAARVAEKNRLLRRRARRVRRLRREVRRGRGRGGIRRAVGSLATRLRPGRRTPADAARPAAGEPDAGPLPEPAPARADLAVAVILDRVSSLNLRHEWAQVEPGPDDWREVLGAHAPRLLFVEAAEHGNDGRWSGAIADQPAESLRELVRWCRDRGIPTVFWSNRAAEHDRYTAAASLFDHVFATDSAAVDRYREEPGDDRIGLLRFAAQPRLHNPVRGDDRAKRRVAFAASTESGKAPRERLEAMVEASLAAGVDVLDLESPYERLLAAYREYEVFLVDGGRLTGSPACPREAFELAGCGTPMVSAPSAALEEVFGGVVPVAKGPDQARAELVWLLSDGEARDRLAHRALREVLDRHTYGDRVAEVLRSTGLHAERPHPPVTAIVPTRREHQLDHVLAQVAGQRWRPLQLVIAAQGLRSTPDEIQRRARDAGLDDVVVLTADPSATFGGRLNDAVDAADGEVLTKLDDDNIYGALYLDDLLLALDYSEAGVVGKMAHYVYLEQRGLTILRGADSEHRYLGRVQGGTLTLRREIIRELRFADTPTGVEDALFARCLAEGVKIYAADRFSFASVRHGAGHGHSWEVSDGRQLAGARSVFYGPPEALIDV